MLVHPREHVEAIRELCRTGGGAIDGDTYAGEASSRRRCARPAAPAR